MKNDAKFDERKTHLVSQLLDGVLSESDTVELNALLHADSVLLDSVTEQLILDSLLADEVGAESIQELVDLIAEPNTSEATSPVVRANTRQDWRLGVPETFWKPITWALATAAVVAIAFLLGRGDSSAFANASTVVRAALVAHHEKIERVYLVQVEQTAPSGSGTSIERDVQVHTQGDKFYVEMNHGERKWVWGRDSDGATWLTLGPRRAMRIDREEIGLPLQHISDMYSLELESLLGSFLRHCRLEYSEQSDVVHTITATPYHHRWQNRIKGATIEVDRETKAVRRLVIKYDHPQQGVSTTTFTLVDARSPDDTMYAPEGHLKQPFQIYSRDSKRDYRVEILTNWFGASAGRWIVTKDYEGTKSNVIE